MSCGSERNKKMGNYEMWLEREAQNDEATKEFYSQICDSYQESYEN